MGSLSEYKDEILADQPSGRLAIEIDQSRNSCSKQ